MYLESDFNLKTFTAEQYSIGDGRVIADFLAKIIERFGPPWKPPQDEWLPRSVNPIDTRKLSKFFLQNPDFGPSTNFAQLLQIQCSYRAIIAYPRPLTVEYAGCKLDSAAKFQNVADRLGNIIFGDDAKEQISKLADLFFYGRGQSRPIRLTRNNTVPYGEIKSYVNMVREVYPNSILG